MSMSKVDFQHLAAKIEQRLRLHPAKSAARKVLVQAAQDVADVCAAANGKFQRARFLEACGITPEDLK